QHEGGAQALCPHSERPCAITRHHGLAPEPAQIARDTFIRVRDCDAERPYAGTSTRASGDGPSCAPATLPERVSHCGCDPAHTARCSRAAFANRRHLTSRLLTAMDAHDDLAPLVNGAAALGIPLDDAQLDQFRRFRDLLLDANTRVNLTA